MSVFDIIIGNLAPHNCLSCNTEGRLLCIACTKQLAAIPERCYRCQQFSPNFLTCPLCRTTSCLRKVQVAAAYRDNAKALIWKLKLSGARAAAKIMAQSLSRLVEGTDPRAVIVPVPTATGRMRRRGYDQAKLLAYELAVQTGLLYRDWLARHGQTHQHGLTRRERLAQLEAAFRIVRPKAVRGERIILVDDVVTTGATLEAAAAILRAAGAREVDAVVFAQP